NLVLKVTSWLEHSGRFKVDVLAIGKKDDDSDGSVPMKPDYLAQLGIELKEASLSETAGESAASVFSAIDSYRPDLVVLGSSVGRFSVFDSPAFLQMVKQLQCPVIVARDFGIPGVRKATTFFMKAFGR
ncbi:MAG: hypothetical protein ACREAO_00620, partial [Nitrososphaera sp.]